MPVLPFTSLIEALIKNIFVTGISNAFFEGTILKCVFLRCNQKTINILF